MPTLIELVDAYRKAKDLAERLRLAEEIIARVGPEVRVCVLRYCRPAIADEVFQETITAITRGLRGFQGDTDRKFRNWCYRVARNQIAKRFRKDKREPTAPPNAIDLDADLEVAAKDEPLAAGERLDLEWALNLLKRVVPSCYEFLWLYHFEAWDYNEIAVEFGLSYDAARMRLQRCRETAADLLNKRP